jgi:hypothetical protein
MMETDAMTATAVPADATHAAVPAPFDAMSAAAGNGEEMPAMAGREATGEPATLASTLLNAVRRMEVIIDEEIAALQEGRRVDYEEFSRRKNRGLLEIVRASRAAPGATHDPLVAAEIERLRAKLVDNQALLQLHVDAVRLVADIICRSLREAESDGTYAAPSRAGT